MASHIIAPQSSRSSRRAGTASKTHELSTAATRATMAVVVVGSANVDLVTCAPRFARPGETLLGSRFEQLFGGKGANQAVAAALLGSRVSMVAKVGADSLGASTLGNFASFGVDAAHVAQTKSAASGVAHIVVDGAGENQIIIVAGANGELAPADVDKADAAIAGARVVLTQLEVPVATTMRALERGRQAGALTVFNAAPAPTEPLPDALFALCDVVCPNETETAILTGLKTGTDEECVIAAKAILAKGAKNVVLTLGARGCCLVRAGETVWVPVPAGFEAGAVADTTGAGDAFLGALAHGVAAGASLADALPGAVAVASRSVLKRGAQASYPALDELPAGTVRRAKVDAAAAPPRPPTPPRAAAADAAAEAAAAATVDGLVGDGRSRRARIVGTRRRNASPVRRHDPRRRHRQDRRALPAAHRRQAGARRAQGRALPADVGRDGAAAGELEAPDAPPRLGRVGRPRHRRLRRRRRAEARAQGRQGRHAPGEAPPRRGQSLGRLLRRGEGLRRRRPDVPDPRRSRRRPRSYSRRDGEPS